MVSETEKQNIEYIQNLRPYLPEKTQKELDEILAYGKEKKAEGERLKKEFWSDYGRDDFKKLLEYKWKYEESVFKDMGENRHFWGKFVELLKNRSIQGRKEYRYFSKMTELEKKRYIDEYLYDYILYSAKENDKEMRPKFCDYDWNGIERNMVVSENGTIDMKKRIAFNSEKIKLNSKKIKSKSYDYYDWRKGNVVMKKGTVLKFRQQWFGDEGAKAVAEKMKLKEGVILDLYGVGVGPEGAEALSKMELKKGVILHLNDNKIGDEGAKAVAYNMELKEGVTLDLNSCGIGVEGVKTIAENMKLKEGVDLELCNNLFGDEGVEALSKMKLEKGVSLHLSTNKIGSKGAKAVAENMKLEEGVALDLSYNKIGDEGVAAILQMVVKEGVALNLSWNEIGDGRAELISQVELKEGVELDLSHDEIGDKGAKAIMKNMELKNGVVLDLRGNRFSSEILRELLLWEQSYRARGIDCKILVY